VPVADPPVLLFTSPASPGADDIYDKKSQEERTSSPGIAAFSPSVDRLSDQTSICCIGRRRRRRILS
jgi:hypothetical protein